MKSPILPWLLVTSALLLVAGARAQESATTERAIVYPVLPDASPKCTLKQRVGLTDIEIIYSRPNMGHHIVFGGIVPYGDFVWRTGDNASTKINFSTAVKLNGVDVPAGKYALYTVPGEKKWNVLIYKDTGLWGADGFDGNKVLAQIEAIPQRLMDSVHSFTIDFDDIHDDSALLCLKWQTTLVPIKLEVDVVPDLMTKLAGAMESSANRTPAKCLQAACFFYDHGTTTKDYAQAMVWVEDALRQNPSIAYELLYVKAELLNRQGDHAGAVDAAQQSSQLAVQAEGPGTPYLKLNQEVISSRR